jgi:integrase
MRVGEAIHLTWADVDLTSKVILIRAGLKNSKYWRPKTKFSIRRLAIVPELEVILHANSRR